MLHGSFHIVEPWRTLVGKYVGERGGEITKVKTWKNLHKIYIDNTETLSPKQTVELTWELIFIIINK